MDYLKMIKSMPKNLICVYKNVRTMYVQKCTYKWVKMGYFWVFLSKK